MSREPISFWQTVWAVALGQILAGVLLGSIVVGLSVFGGLARWMLSTADSPHGGPMGSPSFDEERYNELFQQELERIRQERDQ